MCRTRFVIATVVLYSMISMIQKTTTQRAQAKQATLMTENQTILHFVWIQPHLRQRIRDSKEKKALQTAFEWQQTVESSKVLFWTRNEIVTHFPELVPLLERLSIPAWISDIVRYHVVHKFGGLYLDTDVHPIQDPTPLLKQNETFGVCQTPWWPQPSNPADYACDSVINAIIASKKPGNEALLCAMTKSIERTETYLNQGKTRYDSRNTGPTMWSECVNDFKLTVLPSWTFMPCPCCEGCNVQDYKNKTYAYGMHEWEHSWW